MPIIIEGYVTVSTAKLSAHRGHHLSTGPDDRVALWCVDDQVVLEQEPEPQHRLYCGCADQYEHDEGKRLQDQYRKRYHLSHAVCIGCYTGDDAPSVHSCAIHPMGRGR